MTTGGMLDTLNHYEFKVTSVLSPAPGSPELCMLSAFELYMLATPPCSAYLTELISNSLH